jgi:hypothetical protein
MHLPQNKANSTNFGRELMDVYKRVENLEIEKYKSNGRNMYKITTTNPVSNTKSKKLSNNALTH